MSDREPQPAGAPIFTFGGASEETRTGIAGTTEAVGAGNPFMNLSNSTAAPSIPDSEPVVTTSPQQPAVNAAPRPQHPIWASDPADRNTPPVREKKSWKDWRPWKKSEPSSASEVQPALAPPAPATGGLGIGVDVVKAVGVELPKRTALLINEAITRITLAGEGRYQLAGIATGVLADVGAELAGQYLQQYGVNATAIRMWKNAAALSLSTVVHSVFNMEGMKAAAAGDMMRLSQIENRRGKVASFLGGLAVESVGSAAQMAGSRFIDQVQHTGAGEWLARAVDLSPNSEFSQGENGVIHVGAVGGNDATLGELAANLDGNYRNNFSAEELGGVIHQNSEAINGAINELNDVTDTEPIRGAFDRVMGYSGEFTEDYTESMYKNDLRLLANGVSLTSIDFTPPALPEPAAEPEQAKAPEPAATVAPVQSTETATPEPTATTPVEEDIEPPAGEPADKVVIESTTSTGASVERAEVGPAIEVFQTEGDEWMKSTESLIDKLDQIFVDQDNGLTDDQRAQVNYHRNNLREFVTGTALPDADYRTGVGSPVDLPTLVSSIDNPELAQIAIANEGERLDALGAMQDMLIQDLEADLSEAQSGTQAITVAENQTAAQALEQSKGDAFNPTDSNSLPQGGNDSYIAQIQERLDLEREIKTEIDQRQIALEQVKNSSPDSTKQADNWFQAIHGSPAEPEQAKAPAPAEAVIPAVDVAKADASGVTVTENADGVTQVEVTTDDKTLSDVRARVGANASFDSQVNFIVANQEAIRAEINELPDGSQERVAAQTALDRVIANPPWGGDGDPRGTDFQTLGQLPLEKGDTFVAPAAAVEANAAPAQSIVAESSKLDDQAIRISEQDGQQKAEVAGEDGATLATLRETALPDADLAGKVNFVEANFDTILEEIAEMPEGSDKEEARQALFGILANDMVDKDESEFLSDLQILDQIQLEKGDVLVAPTNVEANPQTVAPVTAEQPIVETSATASADGLSVEVSASGMTTVTVEAGHPMTFTNVIEQVRTEQGLGSINPNNRADQVWLSTVIAQNFVALNTAAANSHNGMLQTFLVSVFHQTTMAAPAIKAGYEGVMNLVLSGVTLTFSK